MAVRNKAVAFIPANKRPLLFFVSAEETGEFRAQNIQLYNKWKDKNLLITFLQLPGIRHFSIPETPTNRSSSVHIALRELMDI